MNLLRDLSLIILALEAAIVTLIPLALFGGVVYGVWWLLRHRNLPTWLRTGRDYLTVGLSYVELAADTVMKPVFAVHMAFATAEAWIRAITGRS
ncbi:MAG: hypothetical protein PVF54_01720 [Anaerolineae bacterium]|jgi:hypothetical protein